MELSDAVFKIDAGTYVERLCDFVRESQASLHREGILVPLSGGLDSSTVLLLCARAVGAEQVTALLLPEKQGNPEAARYARLIADRYGIATLTRDISPVLASLGTYKFILSAVPLRSVQDWVTQTYLKASGRNTFMQIMRGEASATERQGYAKYMTKQRVRVIMAYLVADELNLLVAGCAHLSEDMVGLFVKFGIDDLADIMPLKHLYRSHIVQLAEYLGVPAEILSRTPNPDIIPGVNDKYADILGLRWDKLDLILYGIGHGMQDKLIAEQLDLPEARVQEIRDLVRQTEHMRNPSLSLTWEAYDDAEPTAGQVRG